MKASLTSFATNKSSAGRLLVLTALFLPDFTRANALDPNAFKADVSRTAVTTLPAFTVDESASAKTHTLFMGADIAINLDKDIYRVRDVFGSNWVIDINGREKEISAKEAPLNLKITPTLKLTEVSATVVGFKKVPAYSYENDPSVRLTKGLNNAASTNNDLLARAQNAQIIIDTMTNKAMGGAALLAGTWDQFSDNAMLVTAQHAFSNLHTTGITGVPALEADSHCRATPLEAGATRWVSAPSQPTPAYGPRKSAPPA